MDTPLIEGCVNSVIKRRLVEAIDEGCSEATEGDAICTHFRRQLLKLPECSEHAPVHEHKPHFEVESEPAIRREEHRSLTDYQKHMSMCLRDKDTSFNICLGRWKSPEERMDKQYVPREGSS